MKAYLETVEEYCCAVCPIARVRIRIGDQTLVACDPVASLDVADCESEVEVEFDHVEGPLGSRAEALAGNPAGRKELVWCGDCRYDGFGQIVALDPVVADFGTIQLELGHWQNEPDLLGRYLKWPISRLDVSAPE